MYVMKRGFLWLNEFAVWWGRRLTMEFVVGRGVSVVKGWFGLN